MGEDTTTTITKPDSGTESQVFKPLQDALRAVIKLMDSFKQPLPELVALRDHMLHAHQNSELTADPAYLKFLMEELAPEITKRLHKQSPKDDKYADTGAEIIEMLIKDFVSELKANRFNKNFYEAMTYVFQPDTNLHKSSFQIPDVELQRLRTKNQTWRQELEVGSLMDAHIRSTDPKASMSPGVYGWVQAKIVQIIDNDTLKLEFFRSTNGFDSSYDRWSTEIAMFESKTKSDHDWRAQTLVPGVTMFECDFHDGNAWRPSTIFQIRNVKLTGNRNYDEVFVAQRYYSKGGTIKDEMGCYKGFGKTFDEWCSVFSPRLQPWGSKCGKTDTEADVLDLEEEQDDIFQAHEGMTRVFAVPRPFYCKSERYLYFINLFGNLSGFQIILDLLENGQLNEELNVHIMGCLAQITTMPYPVFHRNFIADYGSRIHKAVQSRLLNTPDQSLRDVRKEKIELIIKAIESISKRFLSKDERENQGEILKLDLSNKCLRSTYLERRIQGIRDLNDLVTKHTSYQMTRSSAFTADQLIKWMHDQDVFTTIWDARKTHAQLVQRSDEIFKLLLKEDKLDDKIMGLFWSLTKSDYQTAVFNIISECSYYLRLKHLDFFFSEITGNVSPEKLSIADFNCLCDMGKQAKSTEFLTKIVNFFWHIVMNSDRYKEDLVENCLSKFAEMVKSWTLDKKKTIFINLVQHFTNTELAALPVLRLFTKMVSDQQEKETKSYSTTSNTITYQNVSTTGSIMTSYSFKPSADEESIYDSIPNSNEATAVSTATTAVQEFTFTDLLGALNSEEHLVQILLDNLRDYLTRAHKAFTPAHALHHRTKLYLTSTNYSHAQEVEERLAFLRFLSGACSEFKITKVQLKVIYDLLMNVSPVNSDQQMFLTWCKTCAELSSPQGIQSEVGEFLMEQITSQQLQLNELPFECFEVLQLYVVSTNEATNGIVKIQPKKVTTNVYGIRVNFEHVGKSSTPEEPSKFKVMTHPKNLQMLSLIWKLVLECETEKVWQASIQFLIQCHMDLDESIQNQRNEICQQLLESCIVILKNLQISTKTVNRVIQLVKGIIQESEKTGVNVKSHSTILQGEWIDHIIVKNLSKSRSEHDPELLYLMKVRSNLTMWEFIDRVSRACQLSPQYAIVKNTAGNKISYKDYGKTLGQVGVKPNDIFSVEYCEHQEEIPVYPLLDETKKSFSDRAAYVFNSWFDDFCTEDNVMTPESATLFIRAVTNEYCTPNDARISGMFKAEDKNQDGKLEREEFLNFYLNASLTVDKQNRVFENVQHNFVRLDLQLLKDLYTDCLFARNDMPRFTLSENSNQFQVLFSLLDRQDASSEEVWSLICMLATNHNVYQQVLSLNDVKDEQGKIQWDKFFDGGSVYEQIYNLEIVEACLEAGEKSSTETISFLQQLVHERYHRFSFMPKIPTIPASAFSLISESQEIQNLRLNWTETFLRQGGLQYVMDFFNQNEFGSSDSDFKMQKLNFMMTLIRVFLSAYCNSRFSQSTSGIIHLVKQHQAFFKAINYSEIQQKLIRLLKGIVCRKEKQATSQEKILVSNCLSIWVGCVGQNPALFDDVLAQEGIDELIMFGILYCEQDSIKDEFQISLYKLAREHYPEGNSEAALGFLLRILSSNFENTSQYPCRHFFGLFNELIDLHYLKESIAQISVHVVFDAEKLLCQIIDKIREVRSTAVTDDNDVLAQQQALEREKLMYGMFEMMIKIFKNCAPSISEKVVREKDLIESIFKEYLFASVFKQTTSQEKTMVQLANEKVKRKGKSNSDKGSTKSREIAYTLLNELIRKSPVIMNNFIALQLKPLMDLIKRPTIWNYQLSDEKGEQDNYVGLRNLGCICYMNSMMQQFFMIPAFRYNLLCVDDGVSPDMKEFRSDLHDDNLLHQMQKLFANLELSERKDYNPVGFCFAFKEDGNKPTNISEQKDAQEFLNLLFDRVESVLKPTPRKYLLQSIFGGKTCSQLVCQACGYSSNRMEDTLCLSLTVKDIYSVQDSLQKMIEGEVINDYKCDGCKKTVDVSKRTLITETPNVLIVHLQRIVFNFDTFRNDKVNQHFEFPEILDLKPYSYHDVIARDPKHDVDPLAKTEAEPDQEEPAEDDCFEYKLVGVNMHSGTANAGHYWSYINLIRGLQEKNINDLTWGDTSKDPWMEFNDSTVSNWNYKEKMQKDCFGDEKQSTQNTYASNSWSMGAYGKSGYMLFYERRIKKPIQLVVPADQAEMPGVAFNEKTKEFIKHVSYDQMMPKQDTPNQIFSKVLDDNRQFSFENDVYSQEFFVFLKKILSNVSAFTQADVNSEELHSMRSNMLKIAYKACFEIIARCFNNAVMKEFINEIVEIFKKDDSLVTEFLRGILENSETLDTVSELILECPDSCAKPATAYLCKYLLARLKIIEKDSLLSNEQEICVGADGNEYKQPKAVSARFINLMVALLNTRVAKNSTKFNSYLDILSSFCFDSAEEIEAQGMNYTEAQEVVPKKTSEAARIGLAFYFQSEMIEKFLDFILGSRSPLCASDEIRPTMTGNYTPPNFSPLIKVVTTMIDDELIKMYPLSDVGNKMLQDKEMLGQLIESTPAKSDFSSFCSMCHGNIKMSKKMAKVLVKGINLNSSEKQALYLKALKKFLLVDDSLKQQRLEWVFGVPQLINKKMYGTLKFDYGVQLVERINDEAYTYVSSLLTTSSQKTEDALFTSLLKGRSRSDLFTCKALKDLLSLCAKDTAIARFVYSTAPFTYQFSRYSDWFAQFIKNVKEELDKNTSTMTMSYYAPKIAAINKAHTYLQVYQTQVDQFIIEDKKRDQAIFMSDDFQLVKNTWLCEQSLEVISHWPPQLIIGKQVGEEREVALYEDDLVTVRLIELNCEFMHSNPTGFFNLSLPEKLMRTQNYSYISYAQYKSHLRDQEQSADDGVSSSDAADVTKDWQTDGSIAPVLIAMQLESKVKSMIKVSVSVGIQSDSPNANLPKTATAVNLFGGDIQRIAIFQKIDPRYNWGGHLTIKVSTRGYNAEARSAIPLGTATTTYTTTVVSTEYFGTASDPQDAAGTQTDTDGKLICQVCQSTNFVGMDFCERCGESLKDQEYDAAIITGYF